MFTPYILNRYYLVPKNKIGEKQKTTKVKKQEAEVKRRANIEAENARRQREVEIRKQKAQETVSEAKPRATISLGFFNFGQTDNGDADSATSTSPKGKNQPRKMANAPRGVPTLYNWRMNRDGSITGYISGKRRVPHCSNSLPVLGKNCLKSFFSILQKTGSKMYSNGESVTTSPITTDSAYGALVETASGSKYYLAPKGAKLPQPPSPPPAPLSGSRTFSLGNPKPSPTPSPASAPLSAARTFSLGKPMLRTSALSPATTKDNKKAPPGVPKLVKWRKNRDSTITGFITGSSSFDEGDRITTSEIVSGLIKSGQVVKTGSGSRYYLV